MSMVRVAVVYLHAIVGWSLQYAPHLELRPGLQPVPVQKLPVTAASDPVTVAVYGVAIAGRHPLAMLILPYCTHFQNHVYLLFSIHNRICVCIHKLSNLIYPCSGKYRGLDHLYSGFS